MDTLSLVCGFLGVGYGLSMGGILLRLMAANTKLRRDYSQLAEDYAKAVMMVHALCADIEAADDDEWPETLEVEL